MLLPLALLTPLVLAPYGAAHPHPFRATASSCSTTTTTTIQVVVPTTTATYTTTPVSTIYATTAQDLGTFTSTVRIPSTRTVATVTSTATSACDTAASPRIKQYTTAGAASPSKRRLPAVHEHLDDDTTASVSACVATAYSTTSVGQTYVFVPGPSTKLYTQYTAFTQATVTVTAYTGTSYVVASATASTTAPCAATVTRDARCAPAAMVSAAGGADNAQYGLEWKSDVPGSGAVYYLTTTGVGAAAAVDDDVDDDDDAAGACCQLCAEMDSVCAGSAWDARTGACALEFAVSPLDGAPNCGESLLAYYGAGPNSPMAPGAGWWVADVCGRAQFGSAAPDDGT